MRHILRSITVRRPGCLMLVALELMVLKTQVIRAAGAEEEDTHTAATTTRECLFTATEPSS